jgi:L-lactate dehydrogenase complex protein LldG
VSTRSEMLARVRAALGRPAIPSPTNPPATRRDFPPLGKVMPPIPAAELIGKFEEELKKVGGIAYHAGSSFQLEEVVRGILASAGEGPVVLSRNPLLGRLELRAKLEAWGRQVISWPEGKAVPSAEIERFRGACFSAAAGITGADFGLAESGSLVLTSQTEGAQLASLAPPVHIALCQHHQVVESLEEVLERLSVLPASTAARRGRSIVFITGQSRTADIEQITIRGVHGPLSLHVVLVDDDLAEEQRPR